MSNKKETTVNRSLGELFWAFALIALGCGTGLGIIFCMMTLDPAPLWMEDSTFNGVLLICDDGSTEWQDRPRCEQDK